MKIAIVTTSYPSHSGDPSGHFVEAEARALTEAGHQVFVLSPFPNQSNTENVCHVQVAGAPLFGWPGALERLKAAPWILPHAATFAASVQWKLRGLLPLDRIIAHWIVPSAWPAALGHAALEVVVHGSDLGLLCRLPRAVSGGILTNLAAQRATFRCVSEKLERELLELCPRLKGRTMVRPCAIDLSEAPTRQQARRDLRLGPEPLVLIVGRLISGKRTSVALNASTLLPGVQTAVVGDGPALASLKAAYPSVRFIGKVPRPLALAWIAAADVLLSASLDEGAPTAVREAVALGVDVVACPSGDLPRWARHEELLWVTAARA